MDDTGVRLMKATKAYIASLGTTGVLLAASILMLAVVSAVVAFDRWPGGEVSTRVQTLGLAERPGPIRVSTNSTAPAATPARSVAAAVATGPRVSAGSPAVAGERFSGGIKAPSSTTSPPASSPVLPAVPKPPAVPQPDDLFDAVSNPGTTRDQVAAGTELVTDNLANGVGQVSPGLGGAVAGTGQAVTEVVRQLPLPDHVLPGH